MPDPVQVATSNVFLGCSGAVLPVCVALATVLRAVALLHGVLPWSECMGALSVEAGPVGQVLGHCVVGEVCSVLVWLYLCSLLLRRVLQTGCAVCLCCALRDGWQWRGRA